MTSHSTKIATENDPRWAAVVARDPRADGQFVYAVKTTGIYCRPSSLARLPKPQNVEFFDTAEQAQAAGYRPSKRAAKDQSDIAAQHAATVAAACRQIETAENLPVLSELAVAAGLSSFHFHRVFKAVTGLTPKGYAAAHRSRRVRERLADGDSVTDALYDAGFNSNSRFYESADQLLGMKPGDYRAAGQNNDIRFAVGQCSLGAILVAQSERGVCAILLGDDPHQLVCDLQDKFRRLASPAGDSRRLHRQLRRYRSANRRAKSDARCGSSLRREQPGGGDSVPPRGAQRRQPVGLSLGCGAQASVA
jgi:AraC family transcriptional regulator of adaptative response/methylated-DNA-[protein]-cysteine methyltransferase